ncbi:MAG TPA: hypothetical protein VGM24_11495 [Puia sp.]
MTDSPDIRSLPGAYQLFLPEQVAAMLHLTQGDGKALVIIHENKMQLEWLAQKIGEQYHSLYNAFIAGKARLKRKKRRVLIILLFVALAAIFNGPLAGIMQVDRLYIKAFIFTLGIICCMQLLKYLAMGMAGSARGVDTELSVLELKELILKDFSPEE